MSWAYSERHKEAFFSERNQSETWGATRGESLERGSSPHHGRVFRAIEVNHESD